MDENKTYYYNANAVENAREAKNQKLIKVGLVALAVVIVGIIVWFALSVIFRKNPYGGEIIIDNFDDYYGSTSQDVHDQVYNALYTVVEQNVENQEQIPKDGALIRSGTNSNIKQTEGGVYYGDFIVDIAELEQSYQMYFEWADDKDNEDLSSYGTLATCIKDPTLIIYPDFDCHDIFTEDEEEEASLQQRYPLLADLPIEIDYYDDGADAEDDDDDDDDDDEGTGEFIHYEIMGDLTYASDEATEQTLTVYIIDYTGGNEQRALQDIRDLGYNPDDYNIVYEDYSVPEERLDEAEIDYDGGDGEGVTVDDVDE